MSVRTWVIILAAGDGTRLAPLTRLLHGDARPKQFARVLPDRTLLQATVERAAALTPPERTVVVVGEPHRALAAAQLAPWPRIHVIVQPRNLGTGPGVLLPLAFIRARDPSARVVVLPSDHYIPRPRPFLEAVRSIVAGAADRLGLIGAAAEHAEIEYGWIVADSSQTPLRPVTSFVEKPSHTRARELHESGALWNTFVMAGSLATFWALAHEHLRTHALALEPFVRAGGEVSLLAAIYQRLDAANFSHAVLENTRALDVAPMADSGWCDWGTPERVLASLEGTPAHEPLLRRIVAGQRRATAPILPGRRRLEVQDAVWDQC